MEVDLKQHVDPITNETVSQRRMPEVYINDVEKVLQGHQIKLNQFMMMSQQIAHLTLQWQDLTKNIDESDGKVREKMKFVCKKLGLNTQEPWTYNLEHKCFELREPPKVLPSQYEKVPDGQK